jgi:hypothetical protein
MQSIAEVSIVPDSEFQRRPVPWEEPRVTVDGVVGQVDATRVPRYGGEPTFARLPRLSDVPRADVAILGVPFDTGVSYRPGARHVAHKKSLKPLA